MAEDVAFVTEMASAAEMGNFSEGGGPVTKDGGALLRISQAFSGLVDCLLSSVEGFGDVAHVLEGEPAAGGSELPQSSGSIELAMPELRRSVAGALKEMVGSLVSDIKANAEVQKLMPAIENAIAAKHHAFFQELMSIPEHQRSCTGNVISPPCEETLVCIRSEVSETARRAGAEDGSVAEMANVRAGGTSVKQEGGPPLLRISQAVYDLVERLLSSLEEFRDVEHTLEVETAAGQSPDQFGASVSVEEARPELLRRVAGALKEMVGALVSGIKANAEVQKLMPAFQKASVARHHAFLLEFMNNPTPQRSCSGNVIAPPPEETLIQTFSKDSRMAQRRTAQRSAGKGQGACKHSCEHHPEVVAPWSLRNLPEELTEQIAARLPLRGIFRLRECSEAWYTISKTSPTFREACSQSRPKFFGLLGRTVDCETMWTTVYDIESKEWLSVELTGLPGTVPHCRWEPRPGSDENDAYRFSMCASDGGLVCFVPHEHVTSFPILVCNPLTSIWRALPLTPVEGFENRKIMMVQLVVEDDTNLYKVILVSREKIGDAISAHFYSSRTKIWCTMDSGLVFGDGFQFGHGYSAPCVFQCGTSTLSDLSDYTGDLGDAMDYSLARDHLFEVHIGFSVQDINGEIVDAFRHVVSESMWSSRSSSFKFLKYSRSRVQVFPDQYRVLLFASSSFVVLVSDKCGEWLEDHHQHIELFDRAADRWEILPRVPRRRNLHYELLRESLMVELRWNIDP